MRLECCIGCHPCRQRQRQSSTAGRKLSVQHDASSGNTIRNCHLIELTREQSRWVPPASGTPCYNTGMLSCRQHATVATGDPATANPCCQICRSWPSAVSHWTAMLEVTFEQSMDKCSVGRALCDLVRHTCTPMCCSPSPAGRSVSQGTAIAASPAT
jgi:hypothetical protein